VRGKLAETVTRRSKRKRRSTLVAYAATTGSPKAASFMAVDAVSARSYIIHGTVGCGCMTAVGPE
jgi:hypothetical protein